jgi:hypothetical protein
MGLCLIQALYGIFRNCGILRVTGDFRVTGSFDNPAGFAASLCAGFPFFFYFVQKKFTWERWVALTAVAAVCVAVALSASRAGIAAMLVMGMFFLFRRFRIEARNRVIISVLAFLAALPGLYFLKKDSAEGRLLIWRCSLEMILDKPFTGHGIKGFKARYMNYQASFFEKHPGSKYAMLADNVSRPFNEYVRLWVDCGLPGAYALFLLVLVLRNIYRSSLRKMPVTYLACLCLIGIGVFALFSYPLTYPFVWVMGFGSVLILAGDRYPVSSYGRAKTGMFLGLALVAVIYVIACRRMSAEIKWCGVAHNSLLGQTEKMLPEYSALYPELRNNELFLYNYAAELNVSGRYAASLQVAHECERLWADYDLQMLLGDNYQKLGQYGEAEARYKHAANMCPVKFMPLYRLFQLYEATGEKEKMLGMAKIILEKPVKIMSSTVEEIKYEARQKILE